MTKPSVFPSSACNAVPVSVHAVSTTALPPAVRRAVDFIERHLHEPVRLADVAAAACLSRYHLARVFRENTGASPMGYLRRRRIEQAQVLLRDGRWQVGHIASELGFFDQSHFIRSFRQLTGCTPTHFAARAAAS